MAYPHRFFALYIKDGEVRHTIALTVENSEAAFDRGMIYMVEDYKECDKMEIFEGYCVGVWDR